MARRYAPDKLVISVAGNVDPDEASKLLNEAYMAEFGQKWYVLFFYVLNLLMVGTDLCLYVRNRNLDKKAGVL